MGDDGGRAVRPPAALRGVDQRLRTIVKGTRIWRDEWVDAMMERCTLMGGWATRSSFEAGGAYSIEKKIENFAPTIKWRVDNMGWPRKQAEAYTLIMGYLKAPLAAAVRERSKRYEASMHVLCEALAQRAKQMTQAAPLVYMNLTGTFGLATEDPAWQALLQPGASAGVSFVTDGIVMASTTNREDLSRRQGLLRGREHERQAYVRAAGLGHCVLPQRALRRRRLPLARSDRRAGYHLPPCATVTLEKVEQPGEWEVRGLKVQQRLLTVRVTWNEKWWWW